MGGLYPMDKWTRDREIAGHVDRSQGGIYGWIDEVEVIWIGEWKNGWVNKN